MNFEVSPPDQVLWIWRTLEEAGFETWIVGGAIRDILLGRPADDWDFATRAHPKQIMAAFPRTVPIGVDHGTVGVFGSRRNALRGHDLPGVMSRPSAVVPSWSLLKVSKRIFPGGTSLLMRSHGTRTATSCWIRGTAPPT